MKIKANNLSFFLAVFFLVISIFGNSFIAIKDNQLYNKSHFFTVDKQIAPIASWSIKTSTFTKYFPAHFFSIQSIGLYWGKAQYKASVFVDGGFIMNAIYHYILINAP